MGETECCSYKKRLRNFRKRSRLGEGGGVALKIAKESQEDAATRVVKFGRTTVLAWPIFQPRNGVCGARGHFVRDEWRWF